MAMKKHTRLDLVEGGNIFKQGDYVTLGFIPRDYTGASVDLTNKQIEGSIFNGSTGVIYEGPASFVDGKIFFTIKQVLNDGKFQLEFTVTDAADPEYRTKFPTDDYASELTIKPSADNLDYVGVSMTTVAQLRTEQEQKQQQFELAIVPQVDELKQRVEEGIGAFTEDTEVKDARMDEINLRTFNQKVVAQLDEKALQSEVDDIVELRSAPNTFVLRPNQSMPTKKGILEKSPKLITKRGDEFYSIVQKANNKYVFHQFKKGQGASGSSDTGVNHELYRVVRSQTVEVAYLAKVNLSATSGTLGTLYAPTVNKSNVETALFNLASVTMNTTNTYSTQPSNVGVGVYSIEAPAAESSVSWALKLGQSRKANVVIFGSSASPSVAEIHVNGEIVKTFDPSKSTADGTTNLYKVVEFDVPISSVGNVVEVKLVNKDTTGKKLFFSCMNLFELKDYNGEDVDMYKVMATGNDFINTIGASDYAILDAETNRWIGSYHGGETVNSAAIQWTSDFSKNFDFENKFSLKNPDDAGIAVGDWIVSRNFEFFQNTTLTTQAGKTAKMTSVMNFDTDGTIDMQFSLYDSQILAKTIYTALTSTRVDFTEVELPVMKTLGAAGEHLYLNLSEGHIVQKHPTKKIKLGIRFNRFDDYHNSEGAYIYNHATQYKKQYYGPVIDVVGGLAVTDLMFSKALDFYIEAS